VAIPQAIAEPTVSLTVNQGGCDMSYTSLERTTSIVGFEKLMMAYMAPVVNEIDRQGLALAHYSTFNTLNTAIALVRQDPARAEGVLEDLADLFRQALADPSQVVCLSDEVALARRYLRIEQARFGPRLRVQWSLDPRTDGVRMGPLASRAQRTSVLEKIAEIAQEAEPGPLLELVTLEMGSFGRVGRQCPTLQYRHGALAAARGALQCHNRVG
jgi:hypothetical protein